jgi:hypothetical protein
LKAPLSYAERQKMSLLPLSLPKNSLGSVS